MLKRMYVSYLICIIMVLSVLGSTLLAASDGYYGKTKVQPAIPIKAVPFDLRDVTLLDSPFATAMEINKEYLLKLDADRFLWAFHERAGLPVKGERYGGWAKKDVVGQVTGHYLSACSLMYSATGDKELKKRIDYMVSEIAKVQKKHGNGYAGPVRTEVWDNTFDGSIESGAWSLGTGYVPLYVIHKTYAGLMDAYVQAGNEQALDVVCKFADWLKKNMDTLSDKDFQKCLVSEHGGMNESMANLYALTGNKDYLALARRFDHKAIIDSLSEQKDELTGKHVNTQLPKFVGAARLYELTGDEYYSNISHFAWDQIINKRSFVTGGVDMRERFYAPGEESKHLHWNSGETCCVYNMLKLTRSLFGWKPDAKYMDYYERGLYNQILGSQDPETGGMTYYYSLKPGHFKIFSTPFDAMWCCVGTGIENHSKYADTIYFHDNNTLWVNLFIPSELSWKDKGVTIQQETKFPQEDTVKLTISTKKPHLIDLKVRVPYWAKQGVDVKVNGKKQRAKAGSDGYLAISRIWKNGDTIDLQIPMDLHMHYSRDDKSKVVVMYGPLALAGELGRSGMPKKQTFSNQGAHSGDLDPPVGKIVDQGKDISKWVKPISGQPLRFKTVGAIKPKDVTLAPIHQIQDQRYTVYWDTITKTEYAAKKSLTPKPAAVKQNQLKSGLSLKYYEGRWDKLPDYSKLSPVKTGVAKNIDVSYKDKRDEFGLVFSGYIKIERDGEYYFAVKSDDGSRVKLGGTEIILSDGIHAMIAEQSDLLELTKGYYPIEIEYFEAVGGEGLEVLMYTEKNGWTKISPELLFHN